MYKFIIDTLVKCTRTFNLVVLVNINPFWWSVWLLCLRVEVLRSECVHHLRCQQGNGWSPIEVNWCKLAPTWCISSDVWVC